ncbi:uncharacterized protein LOC125847236 [Solanum stenotomum]|uniref:uncharacterized protein LOC125847236 n=1 Tax=Solanum stenotomum TaxID=172797 RepID=UPI0020D17BC5|nr:uncharacterized protein LOC125847236 [Solanum stenotomum]
MVQLLHTNGQFTDLSHEDPQVHLQNFLEISDMYTPTGVNSDYVRLTLFPFSLLGEAKRWLNFEPANSITTWDDLAWKFLIRFFPSGKTAKLRNDILSFRQKGGGNLYQAWDRFKSMLLNCGQALEKTYAELFTLLNRISQGNPKWNGGGAKPNVMTPHFNNISLGQQQAQVNMVQQPQAWCEVCGGGDHSAEVCGANPESVHFVGNAQRGGNHQNYGNTYNPSWRNHPNFSWGGNQNQHQGQNQYMPHGSGQYYNQQNHGNQQNHVNQQAAKQGDMSVEDMLKQIMADQAKLVADVRNNQLATQNLEKKFG